MHTSVPLSKQRLRAALTTSLALVVSVAVVLAVASPSASGASTPKCGTSGLVIWLDTNGNGSAGHIEYNLEFTNLSGHKCTLNGYPRVAGINLAGHQLGAAATKDTAVTPSVVTLAKGKTAHSVLRLTNVGVLPASSCHPVTAAGLRVRPPNGTSAKTVPFPFGACSKAGAVYMSVRPVQH